MDIPSGYKVEILADSVASGVRLTTLLVRFPRFILAEVNTHRTLSRNSASSRAIPLAKRIQAVRDDPFVPHAFGKNQRGMQAGAPIDDAHQTLARRAWLSAAEMACGQAEILADTGVHKQWASRLLEPYLWHEAIISATEWSNFFNLRINPQAQPEFQFLARCMKAAMDASTPTSRQAGQWHLPMINDYGIRNPDDELPPDYLKIAVARCARVSYLTHDGKLDPAADIALHDKLLESGHMSPFEHVAVVGGPQQLREAPFSNFRAPWIQYRKLIHGEADILGKSDISVEAGSP